MTRYYLNKDVIYRSKPTFSCIYHLGTGWYYPCKAELWRSLQSYRQGREIELSSAPPALAELVENRFIIPKKTPGLEDYLDLYPLRVPGTVYLDGEDTVEIAVERIGLHREMDFEVQKVEGAEAELWRMCDGSKQLREVVEGAGLDGKRAHEVIKRWVSLENQLLRLLSRPFEPTAPLPNQLIYKAPFLPRKKDLAESSAEDVRAYHLRSISNGAEQFDRLESTLSHLYRVPHPILGWRSYGQRLYERIKEELELRQGMGILEVGGGIGSISRDILAELRKEGIEARYVICDLSPALINMQRELHRRAGPRAHYIHGTGELLALRDGSMDIAISNEAIADFHTPELPASEVGELLSRHEIPVTTDFFHWFEGAPENVRVNLGAFQLLKELYRVLRPGGIAIVTEYGYQDRLPHRAKHLDHPEYTIHFGQMISVATALGFDAALTDAWDYLGFRGDVPLMTHRSYMSALRLLQARGRSLPNIAYTEELLRKQLGEEAARLKGIRYVEPRKEPFKIMKVLLCRKPGQVSNEPIH